METLEEVAGSPTDFAITCAGPPVAVGTWTDILGTVHERMPGSLHATRCELNAGREDDGRPIRGCLKCVRLSLNEYARNHDCGRDGCIERLGSTP